MKSILGNFISRGIRTEYFAKAELAEEELLSIKAFITVVMSTESILFKHKKRFISKSLWNITNPISKYKYLRRYRSKGVLEGKDESIPLQHEHVFEKKQMVDRILKNPSSIEEELRKAVGCVVTKPEHDLLRKKAKGLDGWKRYDCAGIKIFDMKKREWIN